MFDLHLPRRKIRSRANEKHEKSSKPESQPLRLGKSLNFEVDMKRKIGVKKTKKRAQAQVILGSSLTHLCIRFFGVSASSDCLVINMPVFTRFQLCEERFGIHAVWNKIMQCADSTFPQSGRDFHNEVRNRSLSQRHPVSGEPLQRIWKRGIQHHYSIITSNMSHISKMQILVEDWVHIIYDNGQ